MPSSIETKDFLLKFFSIHRMQQFTSENQAIVSYAFRIDFVFRISPFRFLRIRWMREQFSGEILPLDPINIYGFIILSLWENKLWTVQKKKAKERPFIFRVIRWSFTYLSCIQYAHCTCNWMGCKFVKQQAWSVSFVGCRLFQKCILKRFAWKWPRSNTSWNSMLVMFQCKHQ